MHQLDLHQALSPAVRRFMQMKRRLCDNRCMRRLSICLAILLTAALAADRGLAGKYNGEWKSGSNGNGGKLTFTLEGPHAETWKSDLSFVLGDAVIPTVMREVKVNDTKVEFTYDFDVQGATLRSHLTGEWNGASFSGKYETTMAGSPVDGGTWNAVREKKQ